VARGRASRAGSRHSRGAIPANWRLASGGSFDGYYTQFAQRLAASGKTNVVVRIGWEINNRTRPWFGGTDPGAFKATWRRIAAILRRHNPTVATEWSNIKKGAQSGSILDLYPGDDVVDIVGVNYYDAWPALNTQAIGTASITPTTEEVHTASALGLSSPRAVANASPARNGASLSVSLQVEAITRSTSRTCTISTR
jgi:hypothetical protein